MNLKCGKAQSVKTALVLERTTKGTLGRWSNAIANYVQRSVGGGVLFNFIK